MQATSSLQKMQDNVQIKSEGSIKQFWFYLTKNLLCINKYV